MASAKIVVNGGISQDELVSVAVHGATVVVDGPAEERLKKTLEFVKAPAPAVLPVAINTSSATLSIPQTRAVIAGLLNQILIGRSGVRVEVATFLATLLNSKSTPILKTGSSVALQLAYVLNGEGSYHGGAAAPAPVPKVTQSDWNGLQALTGATAGAAAAAVVGANAGLVLADAVAALAIEALQSSVEPFDDANNFNVRALAGQYASAGNIGLMLEGSLLVGKASGSKALAVSGHGSEAVIVPHQFHGSAQPALASLSRIASTELHSAVAVPLPDEGKGKKKSGNKAAAAAGAGDAAAAAGAAAAPAADGPAVAAKPLVQAHAQPLLTAIAAAAEAVDVLIAASNARVDILRIVAGPATSSSAAGAGALAPASQSITVDGPSAADASLAAAVDLQSRVDTLILSLAAEMAVSESIIGKEEKAAGDAAAAKEKSKAAAAAAREQAEAARVAAMGPEERAKWDAEQAKKKEKAAKRAEKDEKTTAVAVVAAEEKSIANPLGLGQGTVEFRNHVLTVAGEESGVAGIAAALSPYFPSAAVLSSSLASSATATSSSPAPSGTSADGTAIPRADQVLRRVLEKLGAGGNRRKPKIAKGARDFMPEQMEVRERAFNTIRSIFKRHGAVEIDTPVFENKETLMGKYGEEGGKLIYDLADQGGELLSLRYDLTVPFARFLAMHGVENIKRYHIAKVYRRDNPQVNKGRYREFYQCDFDIAGTYAPMMPDAEVLKVCIDILTALPIGPFTIKLNHRKLLDAVLDIAGVPASKFRPICSAIDKLDKEPWSDVRAEMIHEKGLSEATADKIGEIVKLNGHPLELHARLTADNTFGSHPGAASALADLGLLFRYLSAMGGLDRVSFDLSLARGLDYYTGVIYEAVTNDESIGVGSIAAGGRYDNLVSMFAANPGTVIPCVGVSIGVERVFAIMEMKAKAAGGALKKTPVQVYVASIPSSRGRDMAVERMAAVSDCWAAGLSAEMAFSPADPKLQKQMTTALEIGVPYLVVLAEDELDRGEVQVKNLITRDAVTCSRKDMVEVLVRMGAAAVHAGVISVAAGGTPTASTPASADGVQAP